MDALNEVDYIVSRMPLWFGGASSEFDQTQRDCKELLNMPGLPNSGCNDIGDSCRSNSFDGAWMVPDARTCLARVILFDQFPRCISRGTSSAFKYEDTAIGAVQIMITNGWIDSQLPVYSNIELLFITTALQHSENFQLQKLGFDFVNQLLLTPSIAMCTASSDGIPAMEGSVSTNVKKNALVSYFKSLKGLPHEHYDCIVRFGRFPSRNNALVSECKRLICRSVSFHCMRA